MLGSKVQEIDVDKLLIEIDDLKNREGQTVKNKDGGANRQNTVNRLSERQKRRMEKLGVRRFRKAVKPSWNGKVGKKETKSDAFDEGFRCGR